MKKNIFVIIIALFAYMTCFSDVIDQRINYLEDSALVKLPTYTLDNLWRASKTTDEKLFLTKEIGRQLKAIFPSGYAKRSREVVRQRGNELSFEEKEYLENMSDLLDCFPNDMPDRGIKEFFLKKALAILEKMDKKKLARLNPRILKYYHKFISFSFKDKLKKDFRKDFPAFIRKDNYLVDEFTFTDQVKGNFGRELPETEFIPLFALEDKNYGALKYIVEYPENVKYNSMMLSDIMNQLSNYNTTGMFKPVKLKTSKEEKVINSNEELIEYLYDSDEFDIDLFEARTLLSLGGLALKMNEQVYPIEFPFYMKGIPNKDTTYIPMLHSEHLLTVYKKGADKPIAVVKWYSFLSPDKNYNQGTYYAPALIGRSIWPGYKVTHVYTKKEDMLKFVRVAKRLQQLFNYIQDAYEFPDQGYAVLAVCNDATSLMETALTGDGTKVPLPNFRYVKFDSLYKNILSDLDCGLKLNKDGYLNCYSDVYPDVNPKPSIADYERIYLSIPFRDIRSAKGLRSEEIIKELMIKSPGNSNYLDKVFRFSEK